MQLSREDYELLLGALSAAIESDMEDSDKKRIARLMNAFVDDYLNLKGQAVGQSFRRATV